MSHIFISYSRKDLTFAGEVVQALAENELDTWIDWKSIPKGEDWEQEIYGGIEEADAFLFLLSPDSVRSEMCNKEIAHAVRNGKRILPIVIRDPDSKLIHPEISKRNWIFCRAGQDDFHKAIEEARTTIHINYEWLKYHTKLQIKALDWERHNDHGRLLRGKELREAEQQLTESGNQKDPSPTALQRQYILASQRNETRVRRLLTLGMAGSLAIMIALSFAAWVQRNNAVSSQETAVVEANVRSTAQKNAEEQTEIARAEELASHVLLQRAEHLDLALLLSVEAVKTTDNQQTHTILLNTLQFSPRLGSYLFVPGEEFCTKVSFAPTGKILAIGCSNTIYLQDVTTGQWIGKPLKLNVAGISFVTALVFSPDGNALISGNYSGEIQIWNLNDLEPVGRSLQQNSPVTDLALDREGVYLASTRSNGVNIWDMKSGERVGELTFGSIACRSPGPCDQIQRVAFSPDGSLLASGRADGTIIFWDMRTQKETGHVSVPGEDPTTRLEDPISSLIFTFDTRLVSASAGGVIQTWDTASQTLVNTQTEAGNSPRMSYTAASDTYTIAIGSCVTMDITTGQCAQGAILLRRTLDLIQLGDPIAVLPSHVSSLAFSADGSLLASSTCAAGGAGECQRLEIMLWDVSGDPYEKTVIPDQNSQALIETACKRAGRNLSRIEWEQYIYWKSFRPEYKTCPQWPAGQ